jgi:hypothetical protein
VSEVIRDAIIRLRLEQGRSKLESPDVANLKRSYEEQAKGAKDVQERVKESVRTTKEATRTSVEFGARSAKSFAQAGSGALQFSRGLALAMSSGDENTQRLLGNLVKIEAAVATLKGGAQLLKFGPIVTAIAAAVGVATVAWTRYNSQLEESKKKHEALREGKEKLNREIANEVSLLNRRATAMQGDMADITGMRGRFDQTPKEREQSLNRQRWLLAQQRSESESRLKENTEGMAGMFAGLPTSIANRDFQRQQLDFHRREIEILSEQRDIDQQRRQDAQATQLGYIGKPPEDTDPLGTLSFLGARQGVLNRNASEGDAANAQFKATLNKILDAMESVHARLDKFQKEVEAGEAAK